MQFSRNRQVRKAIPRLVQHLGFYKQIGIVLQCLQFTSWITCSFLRATASLSTVLLEAPLLSYIRQFSIKGPKLIQ